MTLSEWIAKPVDETVVKVLIPILMDDPLGGFKIYALKHNQVGLNPYSNGWPSRGYGVTKNLARTEWVLIPILMDDPLGAGQPRSVCRLSDSS